jgi:hypothetical protein
MIASTLLRALLPAAGLALAASGPCLADSQLSRSPGTPAVAHLMLQVSIPALARVMSSGQPGQLTVSPDDVERGFVDVADARIEVLANQRGGKRLVASVIAAFARSVEIAGLPQAVVVAAAGPQGDVRLPESRRGVVDSRYDVRYRIHLDRGIAPGVYPWPVHFKLEVD